MYKNLFNLICLTKESKKSFLILVFLLIISSLLEVIGLGLIIPLITSIVDHEAINSMDYCNTLDLSKNRLSD